MSLGLVAAVSNRPKPSEKQLDFLMLHYTEPGRSYSVELPSSGHPDALMRSLARRGLIWIKRRQAASWRPLTGWRDDRANVSCHFGLTVTGQMVANWAIKQKIGDT